jgi:hypothetical protein
VKTAPLESPKTSGRVVRGKADGAKSSRYMSDREGKTSRDHGCGVIIYKSDIGQIFGVEIDRRDSKMQTVQCWRGKHSISTSPLTLDTKQIWFPY